MGLGNGPASQFGTGNLVLPSAPTPGSWRKSLDLQLLSKRSASWLCSCPQSPLATIQSCSRGGQEARETRPGRGWLTSWAQAGLAKGEGAMPFKPQKDLGSLSGAPPSGTDGHTGDKEDGAATGRPVYLVNKHTTSHLEESTHLRRALRVPPTAALLEVPQAGRPVARGQRRPKPARPGVRTGPFRPRSKMETGREGGRDTRFQT